MSKEKEPKQSSDHGWNHPIDPAWERAAYDGIKGFPPEWVPEPIMKQFCEYRGSLFFEVEQGKVNYQEIKSRFDWMVENIDHAYASFDALVGSRQAYDAPILELANLFKWVLLGPAKGIEGLAGDDAVSGYKSRQGHKQRDKYRAKLDYQKQAKTFFEANNYNIAATIKEPALSGFRSQHYGAHTLRDWLKEIRPEGMVQKGRPKKI